MALQLESYICSTATATKDDRVGQNWAQSYEATHTLVAWSVLHIELVRMPNRTNRAHSLKMADLYLYGKSSDKPRSWNRSRKTRKKIGFCSSKTSWTELKQCLLNYMARHCDIDTSVINSIGSSLSHTITAGSSHELTKFWGCFSTPKHRATRLRPCTCIHNTYTTCMYHMHVYCACILINCCA